MSIDPTTPEGRTELLRLISRVNDGYGNDTWDMIAWCQNHLPAFLPALDQAQADLARARSELQHTENVLGMTRYGRTQGDLAVARVRKLADNDDLDWWVQDMILAAIAGEQ